MSDNFNYSATVSADMGDFIQSMKDAQRVMEDLESSSSQLDNAVSRELAEGIKRLIPHGNRLEQMLKAGGSEATEAAKQIKIYGQALEQAARKGADFLSGSNLTTRMGLRTAGEREQDRQYEESQKAHQDSIRAKIAQEKQFIDDAKRFAKEYKDSQLGAVKEVTEAAIDSAERRINAIRNEVDVNSRAGQDAAIDAMLRASAEEKAYQRAEEAKLAHLETFRREGQTLQDVQAEHEKYMNTVSNTRYALYDVATTMTVISGATLGAVSAGVALSASYERAFSDVARVSGGTKDQVAELKRELMDLHKVVPESFSEVAKVATLGGQMNIPIEALKDFTDTVLMFSSATGVSVEQTAASIGRLAQMTNTATDELENLGSSVYHVGINSVATEGEILNVAEQISATANLAGFANHEIVGLASAMASLGIAPQMARGATLRVFRNISDAVDEAGEDLAKFAQVANMTAEEFARAWSASPAKAFEGLLRGMGSVADAGGNLNSVLRDLGITQTQDSQVMLMLAQNTDVYANALDNAASSYAEGTALQEGFAITAGTLVERLKTLWNVVKVTVVRGFEPLYKLLGALLKPVEMLATGFEKVVNTRIGSYLFSFAAGGTAIIGTIALVTAVASRMGGAFLGILRSLSDVNRAVATTSGGMSNMARSLGIVTAELGLNTASVRANAVAWAQLNLSKAGIVENAGRVGASLASMGGALLRSASIIGGVMLAVQGLTWAWDKLSGAAQERRLDELFGSSNLQEAIQKDTAAMADGAEAYRTFSREVETSTEFVPEWARALETSTEAQGDLKDSITETSEAIKTQMGVMGEHYRRGLLEGFFSDEDVQDLYKKYGPVLEELGVSLADAVDEALARPGGGAAYIDSFIDEIKEELRGLDLELIEAENLYGLSSEQYQEVSARIDDLSQDLVALRHVKREVSNTDLQIVSDEETYKAKELLASSTELGDAFYDVAEGAGEAEAKIRDFSDSLFDAVLGQADSTEALWKLIDGLMETEEAFDLTSENGIQNMRNLEAAVSQASHNAAGDANAYIANLLEIYSALEFVGVEGSAEIDFLGQHLAAVFHETWGLNLNVNPARASAQAVLADMIRVLEAKALMENTTPPRIGVPSSATPSLFQRFVYPGPSAEQSQIQGQISALKDLQSQLGKSAQEAVKYGNTTAKAHEKANRAARGGGGGGGRRGGGGGGAGKREQQEVRTFTDYASDLNNVLKRATDIRFGLANAQDRVADTIQTMKDRFEAAEKAIRDARQQIRGLQADLGLLQADKSKMEYHLSIAIEYGDTKRAEQLRAELAKVEADLAEKSNALADARKDLSKAEDDNTRSLVGNTEGARRNRAEVQALTDAYTAEIIEMAEAGATQSELERRTKELRAEFERQVKQLGFNQEEVRKFSKTFDDLTVVISKVPRNITVKANANPAIQAFNEFAAKSKNKINEVDRAMRNLSGKRYGGPSIGMPTVSGGISRNQVLNQLTRLYAMSNAISNLLRFTNLLGVPAASVVNTALRGFRNATAATLQGFQHGGLVPHPDGNYGRMGTDRTPAMLTPGEYVIPKKAVDYYGVPFMNALRSMKAPKVGFGGGGQSINVSANVSAVSLTPGTVQAIAQAVQPYLVLDNKVIAQANGASNRRSTNVGAF